jgi:ribosomal protein L7/L12
MARLATSKSDVLEQESVVSVAQFLRAGLVLVLGIACLYGVSIVNRGKYPPGSFQVVFLKPFLILLGIVLVLGAVVGAVMGALRMKKVKDKPAVTVNCPYCGFPTEFLEEPSDDYDCEGCHRRVYYENGRPVPIKEITCTFCKTVHKVSSKATHFTCDRCNRALRLTDPNNASAIVGEAGNDVLQNFDVMLTDVGRNRNEVALALQSILICNLPEARRQMETLPLTVIRNVPERKADAVRRRLRDLGAMAVVKPTEQSEQARAGRP